MADFFTAALPFIAIGLAIALLAANARRGRERKNYLTEGMCLGLALGAGCSGLLQWSWGCHVPGPSAGAALGPAGAQGRRTTKQRRKNGINGED